ncbi:MAG: hypothetical protein ACIAS6_01190 [Phycisphaerales bacterium JB060]
MARSGASILSANGSIHGNRYHISAMVQGPEEQIHTLISNRRSHPDCSTIPGPVLHHETPVLIPCLAFQLHLAAHDDAQLLAVLEDADRLNIDLAGFDIARIRIDPAHQHRDDFEIDDATHLLGAELRFEVEESQVEHLARFKALLACLRSQPDYVDISEISPRPGPWWCFRTYRR